MIGKDAFAATWTEMEILIIGTLVRPVMLAAIQMVSLLFFYSLSILQEPLRWSQSRCCRR